MDVVRTQQNKKIHPHKFTLWVAMASIIMMFAGLTSAYIVKSNAANWEVIQTPKGFWYATVVIIISSITMQMAVRSFKQREMQQYRGFLAATAILGMAFIAIQYSAFQWMWQNGVSFKGAGQGQFLYVIAGLHALHVLGGVIALLVMVVKAFTGKTKVYSAVPVEVASIYWHFIGVLWVYLLIFFIWLG